MERFGTELCIRQNIADFGLNFGKWIGFFLGRVVWIWIKESGTFLGNLSGMELDLPWRN